MELVFTSVSGKLHVLDYIVLINSYKRMSWVIAMTKEQHSVIDY